MWIFIAHLLVQYKRNEHFKVQKVKWIVMKFERKTNWKMFSSIESAANCANCTNIEHNFQEKQIPQINRNTNNIKMEISDNDTDRTQTDLSNLKVTVGIDEDLQMILEMDPSIVDLVRILHL